MPLGIQDLFSLQIVKSQPIGHAMSKIMSGEYFMSRPEFCSKTTFPWLSLQPHLTPTINQSFMGEIFHCLASTHKIHELLVSTLKSFGYNNDGIRGIARIKFLLRQSTQLHTKRVQIF